MPSNSFRDGVLMYQCAVAAACPGGSVRGFSTHAVPCRLVRHDPAEIAAHRSAADRAEPRRVASTSSSFPRRTIPGRDANNIDAFRFAAPIENVFYTLISRVDYNLPESGSHKLFGRFGMQDDTINDPPQFPGQGRDGSGSSNNSAWPSAPTPSVERR